MPFFSVIIPSYNREQYIAATIRSVLAQTFSDYEIIVVDDQSKDRSVEVAQSFGDRVRVFTQPNSGPGPARNLGAKHAKGTYLAFLDSDDLWFPWSLQTYHDVIQKHNATLVTGAPFYFDDEARVADVAQSPLEVKAYPDYYSTDPALALPSASFMVVRAETFAGVGGFTSERVFSEDLELYLRLGVAPGFALCVAPLTVAYRRHAGSAMHDTRRIAAGIEMMLRHEHAGIFPGGADRKSQRWHFLAHGCRNVSTNAARAGLPGLAMSLYRRGLLANIGEGRWRYVVGLPLLAAAAAVGLLKPAQMHGAEVRKNV